MFISADTFWTLLYKSTPSKSSLIGRRLNGCSILSHGTTKRKHVRYHLTRNLNKLAKFWKIEEISAKFEQGKIIVKFSENIQ